MGDTTVHHTTFSADGRTLATVGDALRLWDVARRTPLDRPANDANGLAFHPGDRIVATGTDDGTVWVYGMPD